MHGQSTTEPTSALVLSGGGTRLSFEIGALLYLYRVEGIAPRIFVGTSAGALLALNLAQGRTSGEQAERLQAFIASTRTHTEPAQFYTATPHTARLLEQLARVDAAGSTEGQDPATAAMSVSLLRHAARMEADSAPQDTTGEPADVPQSLYTVGPALRATVSAPTVDPQAVASSGNILRLSMVGLESGHLHFAAEDGSLRDRDDHVLAPPGTVDLTEAALASSSLPGVLPPRLIHEEHYLDGGMREFLPAELVLDHLAPATIYAVTTRPVHIDRAPSFAGRSLFDIMARMHGEVMSDEALRQEVRYAASAGVTIIEPQRVLHSAVSFDLTLFLLAVADGWMAAAARCRAIPGGAEHGWLLTTLRRRLAEAAVSGEGEAQARADLEAALTAAPEGLLPPMAETWLEQPIPRPWGG